LRFSVNGLEGIARWIYRWLPYVEVVSPKELRQGVKEELGKALKKYHPSIKGRG
jgi:predicted DNA-binding transcriptional regulator YafY